jgi:hypothetical protein
VIRTWSLPSDSTATSMQATLWTSLSVPVTNEWPCCVRENEAIFVLLVGIQTSGLRLHCTAGNRTTKLQTSQQNSRLYASPLTSLLCIRCSHYTTSKNRLYNALFIIRDGGNVKLWRLAAYYGEHIFSIIQFIIWTNWCSVQMSPDLPFSN